MTDRELLELVCYEPETGIFTSKVSRGNAVCGKRMGYQPQRKYSRICLDAKEYLAHRIAWFYVHGEWPAQQIDHINGDKHDNRICNLRDVSPRWNMQNSNPEVMVGQRNTAKRSKKPYKLEIRANGVRKNYGFFDSKEEAHAHYLSIKKELHPGWERMPNEE